MSDLTTYERLTRESARVGPQWSPNFQSQAIEEGWTLKVRSDDGDVWLDIHAHGAAISPGVIAFRDDEEARRYVVEQAWKGEPCHLRALEIVVRHWKEHAKRLWEEGG